MKTRTLMFACAATALLAALAGQPKQAQARDTFFLGELNLNFDSSPRRVYAPPQPPPMYYGWERPPVVIYDPPPRRWHQHHRHYRSCEYYECRPSGREYRRHHRHWRW